MEKLALGSVLAFLGVVLAFPFSEAYGLVFAVAFTFFVSLWMYGDSEKRHYNPDERICILVAGLIFGLIGLIVYIIFRRKTSRSKRQTSKPKKRI